jgi:acyl phosphate:glycerol-3-phosphate acyltransferase
MIVEFILFAGIAYLLGSIPTAVWVGKKYYNLDVREHGSKNAGATNTFRVLGKKPGTIVLLIDIAKGCFAVLLPYFVFHSNWDEGVLIQLQLLTAITAVLGHVFPIFAGFRGGKGVATSLGIIIGIHPLAALICFGLFSVVFIISKYVSLGAITAALSFPLLIIFIFKVDSIYLRAFAIVLGAVVILAHKKNIARLLHGEESKMNLFRK